MTNPRNELREFLAIMQPTVHQVITAAAQVDAETCPFCGPRNTHNKNCPVLAARRLCRQLAWAPGHRYP